MLADGCFDAARTVGEKFLSDEDFDLRNLSEAELLAYWNAWLHQAQSTNDRDARLYSHGVFRLEPPWDGLTIEQIIDPNPSEFAPREK